MGVIFARQSSPDTRGADISHLSRVNDVLWCDNWNGSSVSECRNFQYLEHEIEMQEYEGSIMKLLNIRISFRLFWSGGKRARTKLFKPFRRKRLDSSGEFCFYFTSSSIIYGSFRDSLNPFCFHLKTWKIIQIENGSAQTILRILKLPLASSCTVRGLPKLEEKIPISNTLGNTCYWNVFYFLRALRVCQVNLSLPSHFLKTNSPRFIRVLEFHLDSVDTAVVTLSSLSVSSFQKVLLSHKMSKPRIYIYLRLMFS